MNNNFNGNDQQNPNNNNFNGNGQQNPNNNGFPNNNGYSSNNGGYPSNGYPNNYNNNYGNNSSNHVMMLAKSCKNLSITYMLAWVLTMAFMIGAAVCFNIFYSWVKYVSSLSSSSYYGYDINAYAPSQYGGFIACIVFVAIFSIVLLVLGILLISKTNQLKTYYNHLSNLSSLFSIGLIFFGLTSVIASFMTISACSSIESQGSNPYNQQGPRSPY